jgi:predicted TIM-barrel enzyme
MKKNESIKSYPQPSGVQTHVVHPGSLQPGYVHPIDKLKKISRLGNGYRRQLWVVAYVNQIGNSPLLEQAYADIDNSFEGGAQGADAVVLINEWSSLAELEVTVAGVRRRYPDIPLGVNYLGDPKEPYGFADSFRLASAYDLQIVWTDFSGVDLIQEREPVSLHDIQNVRPGHVFYASGIHMKYSTLRQPEKTIEESALQAIGWVDGVIVTGPKTGVPCNPELAARARHVLHDYPLGVASGVNSENAYQIKDIVDFCLVASSLQDGAKRISAEKVRNLRLALGAESYNLDF